MGPQIGTPRAATVTSAVGGPYRGEALPVIDEGSLGGDPAGHGGTDRPADGTEPLLPRVGGLGRQVEAAVELALAAWEATALAGPDRI